MLTPRRCSAIEWNVAFGEVWCDGVRATMDEAGGHALPDDRALLGSVIVRAIIGVLLALGIAFTARRAHALDTTGAIAAVVLGSVAMTAGWSWGALLIIFFVASAMLSNVGADVKADRTAGVLDKVGARDAVQVLANGGLFGAAALLWLLFQWEGWMTVAAGALAAATADTWGTEVGTLARSEPRMVTTWEPVPAGTSGAITPSGMVGTVSGAAFVALCAAIAGWPGDMAVGASLGGISGALADSFIGARWQARRRCPTCDASTERHVHRCGSLTSPAGGVSWLDNDVVNLIAASVGGIVALVWWVTR